MSVSNQPQALSGGRYQLRHLLGEGGRKRVYLAYDARLDRDVALALIKTEGIDATGIARVQREAQAMGRLGDHPHIVTIYDVGDEHGQPYIVSQYMAGGSVEDVLKGSRVRGSKGSREEEQSGVFDSAPRTLEPSNPRTLALDEAQRIADHVCRALEHAHAHGIIHRDLKPANVWLTADGTAKLGDFGLALTRDHSRVTVEGMMVGTVAYMPPEQALGKTADARSDLYALGALLYELVTGRPPFLGDDAVAVVSQHLHTTPVAPSWHNAAVPPPLEALVLRLLEKDPARRPQSASEVKDALQGLCVGGPRSVAAAPEPRQSGALQSGPSGESSNSQSSALSRQSCSPSAAKPPSAANPLDRLDAGVFVGREKELTALRSAVEDALAGCGRVVLLAGEPGIGKTRTTQELATYAQLRGMQVLWGRGYEGSGAPAYWPWVQIIRSYVHDRSPQELLAEMGPGAADIANVISAVRERLPGLPPPPRLEPEQERFRLFDSVTTFLKNAATRRALMLVLDDLHWADAASLLLLQFLARETADTRLVVVGTYRDEEVPRGQPLFQALAELARAAGSRRSVLRGLTTPEIAQYIQLAAGQPPTEQLVTAIAEHTEGNPFFVGEVVRWLVAEGRLEQAATGGVGVPPSVREVIARRLERLSAQCNAVLSAAAVAGRSFNPEILARATDLPETQVLEALEEAAAARVVCEASEPVNRYTFVHSLIRETVYAELTAPRRLGLHRRIGEILEALHGIGPEPAAQPGSRLLLLVPSASGLVRVQPPEKSAATRPAQLWAELAYHFGEAAPLGEVEKATTYAQRAAERAMEQLAFEDAIVHCHRALRVLEGTHREDPRRRYELLLTLAAGQSRSPEPTEARATLLQAIELARQVGDGELLAAATLGLPVADGVFDPEVGDLLEEGLRALGSADSLLRALVLGRLAKHLRWSPAWERSATVGQEAVEVARRVGDQTALAHNLINHWHSIAGPDALDEQLALANEMLDLASAMGHKPLRFYGLEYRSTVRLLTADVSGAYDDLDAGKQLLTEIWRGRDAKVSFSQATRALLEGRFAVAEQLAHDAFITAQRIGILNAGLVHGAQTHYLQKDRGDLHDLVAAVERFVAQYPAIPVWRCALAALYAELGSTTAARAELEHLARHDFSDLHKDFMWLGSMSLLAETCAHVGDARRASMLYELLCPYGNLNVVYGAGVVCRGAVSHFLGLLATTLQRWDDAQAHFEHALQLNRKLQARPAVARTQHAYAAMLLARDAIDDRTRALPLLNQAIDGAQALGMKVLLERALALKLDLQGVESSDTKTSIDSVAAAVQDERPDLRPHAAPDGTVTILFSDIEGFTALTGRLGDQRAHAVLQAHNRLIRQQLARHDGFEVKSQGDGFMIAFQSARRALLCAIAVQRALAGYAAEHPEEPIRVRIGLHTGEAIKEGDDFFGSSVNLAARIGAQARGGEILVSALLQELTESAGDIRFGVGRAVTLKGIVGTRTVFPVPWAGEASETPAALEPVPGTAILRQEGEYWTVAYAGSTGRLRDMKGLQYLAHLLRHPGQEFHAVDLVQGTGVGTRRSDENSPARGSQNRGLEALDATAKAAYKRRLAALREELDEAEEFNDPGRVTRARQEIDAISEQLATAVGLGGRDRQTGATAERARSTVTKRIKDAIKKIGDISPALADHLSGRIKTGSFCVYGPDATHPITWEL